MENEAVSFLTCTHTWRLLPRSEELAHGLDRAPKRLPLPSHPFQQVDRRCGWRQASGMPEFSPFQSEIIVKVLWYRFSIVEKTCAIILVSARIIFYQVNFLRFLPYTPFKTKSLLGVSKVLNETHVYDSPEQCQSCLFLREGKATLAPG